jgi:DNA-binding transcriptional LysR family regulator
MTAFEDLNLLRTFVVIVDCGSISAGARSLRVSQPALSRQLRTLEDRCGMALLRRDTHQMSLTEAGVRFLEDARTLLAQATAADRRLREQHTTLSGHLRLFATVDCGQFGVTRLISQFLLENPQVTASLSLSNRPLRMIQEGADVGVLPGRITDESVVARKAGAITLHLAAAPSLVKAHPLPESPLDLAAWPWMSLEGSQFWGSREVTLHGPKGATHTQSLSPVFTSEGVTSLREAARSGLGLTVLPTWLIEDDLRDGTLVRVLPQWKAADLPVHVIYAGHRLLPLRVSAFIDFAVKHLSANGDCSIVRGSPG